MDLDNFPDSDLYAVTTVKPSYEELEQMNDDLKKEVLDLKKELGDVKRELRNQAKHYEKIIRDQANRYEKIIRDLKKELEDVKSKIGGPYNLVTCVICDENLLCKKKCGKRSSYMKRTILPCKHVFHYDCFMVWKNRRCSCPICRETWPELHT